MDADEIAARDRFVRAWIAHAGAEIDSDVFRENDWAAARLDYAMFFAPEHAWEAILAIVRAQPSQAVLGLLAAGPFEILLSHQGAALIDQVEEQARADAGVRELLAGIWQRKGIDDALWERLQTARKVID